MTKLKILIIEDEEKAAERLISLIKQIDENITILSIIESVEDAIKWFENNDDVDLIFLDIQLSDGMSFNIFEKVEVNTSIIFTTAFDEFALKAFELNSIDYLLKPIDPEKLKQSIFKFKKVSKNHTKNELNFDAQKLLEALKSQKKKTKTRFLVNKRDNLIVIDINQISYFYTEDKAVFITTFDNNKYIINNTLDNLEKEIEENLFYRINRQFFVSVKSIEKIINHFNYKLKLELHPKTNTEIIISKSKSKDFKNWLSSYWKNIILPLPQEASPQKPKK